MSTSSWFLEVKGGWTHPEGSMAHGTDLVCRMNVESVSGGAPEKLGQASGFRTLLTPGVGQGGSGPILAFGIGEKSEGSVLGDTGSRVPWVLW